MRTGSRNRNTGDNITTLIEEHPRIDDGGVKSVLGKKLANSDFFETWLHTLPSLTLVEEKPEQIHTGYPGSIQSIEIIFKSPPRRPFLPVNCFSEDLKKISNFWNTDHASTVMVPVIYGWIMHEYS